MSKRIFKDCPDNDTFNWALYENGFNGTNLVKNKSVSVDSNDKIVVYCHEDYARELLAKYISNNNENVPTAKDMIPGRLMKITNISVCGKNNLLVDTTGGGSFVIDLNKERELVKAFGVESVEMFAESIKEHPESAENVIAANPYVKVLDNRVSMWEGHLDEVSAQLEKQLKSKESSTYFNATILETNNGGYIVDIGGLKCFMPGSMAAAGIITDFQSLIGKSMRVMVVNYIQGKGYVVSYKKYLSTVMPKLVSEQLSVDMRVYAKVTGLSKNGIFVQFDDKDGEPTFGGLIYRDDMSPAMEEMFNDGVYMVGDMLYCYIHAINMEDGKVRIVLGDTTLKDLEASGKSKPTGKKRKVENGK